MATKRPAKPRRPPLEEAADSSTDPERLRQLSYHDDKAVHRTAWKNPSLPEDVWREILMQSQPEVWDNPMASFYVLAWTPRENDSRSIEQIVRFTTWLLWREPERCSPEGKVLLNAKLQDWWANSQSADELIVSLGKWAEVKGDYSIEHREVVRILVLCAQTIDLKDKDRRGLDLLIVWIDGGKEPPSKSLAYSSVVNSVLEFAWNPSFSPWDAISEIMLVIRHRDEDQDSEEAEDEHQRMLADLIRREMPLPPVVA